MLWHLVDRGQARREERLQQVKSETVRGNGELRRETQLRRWLESHDREKGSDRRQHEERSELEIDSTRFLASPATASTHSPHWVDVQNQQNGGNRDRDCFGEQRGDKRDDRRGVPAVASLWCIGGAQVEENCQEAKEARE